LPKNHALGRTPTKLTQNIGVTNADDTPTARGDTSPCISLYAAETLTGRSRRTLWRKVADGTLPRGPDDAQGRATVPWLALSPWLKLPPGEPTQALVLTADAGVASAQAELGEALLQAGAAGGAVYWFQLAAKQGAGDAMHWLAMCHLRGEGCEASLPQGMVWLAKAAGAGHRIAQSQLEGWRETGGLAAYTQHRDNT
jgi:hypothetical protein